MVLRTSENRTIALENISGKAKSVADSAKISMSIRANSEESKEAALSAFQESSKKFNDIAASF